MGFGAEQLKKDLRSEKSESVPVLKTFACMGGDCPNDCTLMNEQTVVPGDPFPSFIDVSSCAKIEEFYQTKDKDWVFGTCFGMATYSNYMTCDDPPHDWHKIDSAQGNNLEGRLAKLEQMLGV